MRIDAASKKKLYRIRDNAKITKIGEGIPSTPGAVRGFVAFSLAKAKEIRAKGKTPILIPFKRHDEILSAILGDVVGGIITQYGHEALHESVLARANAIPLIDNIVGAVFDGTCLLVNGHNVYEETEIVMDGNTGNIYITTDEDVLVEDKIFDIEGLKDFDYAVEQNKARTEYQSYEYSKLITEHAKLLVPLISLKEVTTESMRANVTAHVIHQIIIEKGKSLNKSEEVIKRDINDSIKKLSEQSK